VVCGLYTKPGRAGKKLYNCVQKDCKNHIHAECNAGHSSFDCTLTNLALLRKLEGSVKEKITFEPDDTYLENRTFGGEGYINGINSERLNLIKTGEIVSKESTFVLNNNTDIHNNKIYIEFQQHRKEHKRKPPNTSNCVNMYSINGKTDDVDISPAEREECKYLDTKTNQHRKEHKRKDLLDRNTKVDAVKDNGENEIVELNETKDMVDLNSKGDNNFNSICILVNFDHQKNEHLGNFSEDEDDEIAETDFDENFTELLEQIYFKGHITHRNRKKYLRKWRKHKKKRKRICKKVEHNPNVNSIIKVDEVEEALTDYMIEKYSTCPEKYSTSPDCDDVQPTRYADKYNELYDEYNHSSNKPEEDQEFFNFVRNNNQCNLSVYELPQITYIIDNTDPDEYKPPNHYFDDDADREDE